MPMGSESDGLELRRRLDLDLSGTPLPASRCESRHGPIPGLSHREIDDAPTATSAEFYEARGADRPLAPLHLSA